MTCTNTPRDRPGTDPEPTLNRPETTPEPPGSYLTPP